MYGLSLWDWRLNMIMQLAFVVANHNVIVGLKFNYFIKTCPTYYSTSTESEIGLKTTLQLEWKDVEDYLIHSSWSDNLYILEWISILARQSNLVTMDTPCVPHACKLIFENIYIHKLTVPTHRSSEYGTTPPLTCYFRISRNSLKISDSYKIFP